MKIEQSFISSRNKQIIDQENWMIRQERALDDTKLSSFANKVFEDLSGTYVSSCVLLEIVSKYLQGPLCQWTSNE